MLWDYVGELCCWVEGLTVYGLCFMVYGFRVRVLGLGFRV